MPSRNDQTDIGSGGAENLGFDNSNPLGGQSKGEPYWLEKCPIMEPGKEELPGQHIMTHSS